MKFNLCYMGSDAILNVRRDFIFSMLFALRDLGHDVILSGAVIEPDRFNLIQGGHLLTRQSVEQLHASGARFAHINTEVVVNDTINHDPVKTDFPGAYLPSLRRADFVWDVIMDNMTEHAKYGTNAHFLRWGWHPKMQDIEHLPNKDLDFYFFGTITQRRADILNRLVAAGLRGQVDKICPYFIRNDRIARARVQLNLIQDSKFTHVNSFRIAYLANNACCILSERENDPADYLRYVDVVTLDELVDRIRYYSADNRWKQRGEEALAEFRRMPMRDIMEELLDTSFGSVKRGG